MDEKEVSDTCAYFNHPLSLRELVSEGARFEINTNFDDGISSELMEELNICSDDEDDNNPVDPSILVSPWTKPFAELKLQMVEIDDYMSKSVKKMGVNEDGPVPANARVRINYNAFWEGEDVPFDSSYLRGGSVDFFTGRNEVLKGLEQAVLTMHRGEEAMFIISSKLLFGQIGCPPRIKPCADGLFIIELVRFNDAGDMNADLLVPEAERNKFAIVFDKVKQIHVKGLDFFGQKMYRNAIRAFEKAVNVLNYCRLENDEEDRAQSAFLVKLHTNLAVCFLKVNQPKRTCIMVNDIRRLTNNKPSCKVLFQEGRAMLLLGEYQRARKILGQALDMEPQNNRIADELILLEDRFSRHKKDEQRFWSTALKIVNKAEENPPTNVDISNGFEQEIKAFKDNLSLKKLKLPPLSCDEYKIISALAHKMELKLWVSPLDKNMYVVRKN